MKFHVVLTSLAFFIIHSIGFCQDRLTNQGKGTAIKTIAKLIDDNYVYADKGKVISNDLLKQYNAGAFEAARDWDTFCDDITKWLQSTSHDGHLYLRHDPKTVQELLLAETQASTEDSVQTFGPDPFFYGKEAAEKNFGFCEIKVLNGNVGYIRLSEINISEMSLPVLYTTMRFVANTSALIIDLRNNGGGGSEVGPVLQSFLLPKDIPLLEFKTRNGQTRMDKTVPWLIERKYEKPLFIVVNKGTASAAEAFAYSLQKNNRAKIIGQSSAGAANMNSWYVVNKDLYLSVSTAAPNIPGSLDSWERRGITPDVVIESDHEIEYVLDLLKKVNGTITR